MVFDVAWLFFELNPQPVGGTSSLQLFGSGLAELTRQEWQLADLTEELLSKREHIMLKNGFVRADEVDRDSDNRRLSLAHVIWDFLHGVVLVFCVEELTQVRIRGRKVD